MNNNYLFPSILKFPSFEDLKKYVETEHNYLLSDKNRPVSFDEIFLHQRRFVIAEPGYGKTRLLKEIVLNLSSQSKKAIFIDLKKFRPNLSNLEDYVISKSKDNFGDDIIQEKKFFILKNSKNVMVCLDALDEVSREDFSKVVDAIKIFSKAYTRVSLFISCRFCHFKEYERLFHDFDSDYLLIEEFSYEKVNSYLEAHDFSKEKIKKINHSIERRHGVRIIEIPRYLEMILGLAEKNGVDFVANLSLADIFEECINIKLRVEGKKINEKNDVLIKRVSSKIALLMEMQQINRLSKKDLMTILDDIKSGLTAGFQHQVSLEIFFKRSLLKDNINDIEFENTEFQEYLAAQEILHLGRTEQIIFDVAIDPQLKEISPSWFNTLSFLVEQDISLLPVLLDFGSTRISKVQDEKYHRLLTQVKGHRLDLDIRKKIFENIFNYYQESLVWILHEIERSLAYYFDPSQDDILKNEICVKDSSRKIYPKGNVAILLKHLIENDSLDGKQLKYWKKKLIEFACDDNTNGVLQRNALSALGKFKNINLLKKIKNIRGSGDKYLCKSFVDACMAVDPNHFFSVESIVELSKRDIIYGRDVMCKINTRQSIKCLLNYFIKDDRFLSVFMDNEHIFEGKDEKLLSVNIAKVFDTDIKKKLYEIVVRGFSNLLWDLAEKSSFMKQIVKLLSEKDRDSAFYFMGFLRENKDLKKNIFCLDAIFCICLKKDQVQRFILETQEMFPEQEVARYVLHRIHQSERSDRQEVYEEGRKYLKEEYGKLEDSLEGQKKVLSPEQKSYVEFQKKLKEAKKGDELSVFRFYEKNRRLLKDLINDGEIVSLKKLAKVFVFEKMSLCTEENVGAVMRRCSDLAWERYLGSCLIIAQDFEFNVDNYRKKIISYMLCDIEYGYLQAIFKIFPKIRNDEISKLLKFFSGRKKNNWDQLSLISTAEKYQVKACIPFLKKIVFDGKIHVGLRDAALKAIVAIECDEKYLKKVFVQYVTSNEDDCELVKFANKILIEKYENKAAIQWVFELLEKGEVSFRGIGRLSSGLEWKRKVYDEEFAKSLGQLNNPKYKKRFLKLLDVSFDLSKEDSKYVEYGSYLREIVAQYFDNLKQTGSYEHLYELEKRVQGRSIEDPGVNWFLVKINDLKQVYMRYFGAQKKISDCIKQYNQFKEEQYLDVQEFQSYS